MAQKNSLTKLSFKYPEYLPKESKTFRSDSPNVFYGGMELLFQFIKLHKGGASSYSVFAFRYLSPAGISSGGVADLAAGMRCALWKGKCMVMPPASHPWPLRLATDGFGANAAADDE